MLRESIFQRLLALHAAKDLPFALALEPLADKEVGHLLLHASAYALSESAEDRARAFEIVSRLLELHPEYPGVARAGQMLLARLGNFPARAFVDREAKSSPHEPITAFAEQAVREHENILQRPGRAPLSLTDFQHDLYAGLGNYHSLSVSAPTSSGKSFVLVQHAVELAVRDNLSVSIFLVPTRALIRQLVRDLRHELSHWGLNEFPVRSVPLAVEDSDQPTGAIYVLTQERLLSLLFSHSPPFRIDALFVDEAHSIAEDSRGVLLHAALDYVRRLFPETKVHFAAPMVGNPEHLQQLFGLSNQAASIRDAFSPVTRNLITVSNSPGDSRLFHFQLLHENNATTLGSHVVPFDTSGGIRKLLADFSFHVAGKDSSVLVYCNSASEAEDVSEHLAAKLPDLPPDEIRGDIDELISHLAAELHPKYPLIDCLRKGVAFHYSDIPTNVRARIEDLAAVGRFRFICSTSTLLQGVNLPAKHLVLRNPRLGNGNPMSRPAFLNLAGRAGRLLKELHGIVWCIDVTNWDSRPFEGPRTSSVHSALEVVFEQDVDKLFQAISENQGSINTYAATAVAKIHVDHVLGDVPIEQSSFYSASHAGEIASLLTKLRDLKASLPVNVYEKNMGLPPNRLENLARIIRGTANLDALIPLVPSEGALAYPRLQNVFELVWRHLEGQTNNKHRYYAWLAYHWMNGQPLSYIIKMRLRKAVQQEPTASEVSKIVRALLEDINQTVSFTFVRDVRAYLDIIRAEMVSRGVPLERQKLRSVDIYLECGAYQGQILSLLALGLSRSTAIELSNLRLLPREATPEDWLRYFGSARLNDLPISPICISEIREHFGLFEGVRPGGA